MRKFVLLIPLFVVPALAAAALRSHPKPVAPTTPTPAAMAPAAPEVCLNPKRDYSADYLSGRMVLIKAKVGKKPLPKLKADTNCIGIDGGVHIKLGDPTGKCVAVGDVLKLRRDGDFGWQTCRITQLAPVTDAK